MCLNKFEQRVRNGDLKKVTLTSYEHRINQLVRQFGKATPLGELDDPALRAWEAAELKRCSRHNATKNRRVLMQMLRLARKLGWYPYALDEVFGERWATGYKPRDRWLTHIEAWKLWRAMHSVRAPHRAPRFALTVAVAASPGEGGRIDRSCIGRTIVRIPGTKNDHRNREVPVLPSMRWWLAQALRYLRVHRSFPRYTKNNMSRDIRAACIRAGIELATWTDLRRTRCMWLRLEGYRREHVASFMGHASEAMVAQVYGKLGGEELKRVMER